MPGKCPECELQASDKALSCPHCGIPVKDGAPARKPRSKNNKRKRAKRIRTTSNKTRPEEPFSGYGMGYKDEKGKPISKLAKAHAFFPTYNDAYNALVEYHKKPI